MTIKSDIVSFLRTDPALNKINFRFLTYKVYPSGYTKDVAGLIDTEKVIVDTNMFWTAAASYFMENDKLVLQTNFRITSDYDLSILVHECTHILLDYQNLGPGSPIDHESVAYLAEAMWREAYGLPSLGKTDIRTVAHRIALSLLSTNSYTVKLADITDLQKAVAAEPNYATKPNFKSDGFK